MPVEFVVVPPWIFLIFLGAVLLVVLLSMLFKHGGTARKITALVIVLVVVGVVAFLFYRPTVLTVDEQGFTLKRFREQTVAWTEVTGIERIADLSVSEYRPGRRLVGVTLGSYRVGKFRLQDGDTAQVTMQQDRNALLIVTAQQRYLFALQNNEKLVEAVGHFFKQSSQ